MKNSGCLGYPAMIAGDMIGHEIENQLDAMLSQLFAKNGQALAAAQLAFDLIIMDGVGGAGHVRFADIGQRVSILVQVIERALSRGRAALPNAHQPDGVKAPGGQRLQLRRRHICQGDGPAIIAAQLIQPDPGIDLINDWIGMPFGWRRLFDCGR